MAGDKRAGPVLVQVAAMAKRNVRLLQQRRRVQNDWFTVSSLARRRKGTERQIDGRSHCEEKLTGSRMEALTENCH